MVLCSSKKMRPKLCIFRWVFEKYDGIRGFWNPLKKAMFSRSGKKFDLPQEVIDDMPSDLFLDGELWYVS